MKKMLITLFVFSKVILGSISIKWALPLKVLFDTLYFCVVMVTTRDCDHLASIIKRHGRVARAIDKFAYWILWSIPWLLYRIEAPTGDAHGYSRREEKRRSKATMKKVKSMTSTSKVFLTIVSPILIWLLVMILTPSSTDVIDEFVYKIFHLSISALELMVVLESLGDDKRDL